MPTCLRLKAAREEKGIKQEELAGHLGISQAQLSRLERGKSRLSVEQLEAAAAYLNVTVSDLVSRQPIAAAG